MSQRKSAMWYLLLFSTLLVPLASIVAGDNYYMPAAGATSVALSIVLMDVTKTLHPPGGATALIAVIGGDSIHNMGYLYVVYPVGLGIVVMLGAAILLNNFVKGRQYPKFWF